MNLSLCCISIKLKEQGIGFQTMTYSRFTKLPYDEALQILSARILNNFEVTGKTIQECYNQGIKGYRLSSNIAPLINHPNINLKLQDLPNYPEIQLEINKIKKIIQNTKIYTSTHPSAEFITLTSDNLASVENSLRDLEHHAIIMDLLELPQSHESPINIHVRKDGDTEIIFQKFAKNFAKLSKSVQSRLVIENNDNRNGVWHIPNIVKYFYDRLGLPCTFDNLHYKICSGGVSEEEAFNLAYNTWDTIPTFHYSEGVNGTKKHADYAEGLPIEYKSPVKWEVEVKMKDIAICKMLSRITPKQISLKN